MDKIQIVSWLLTRRCNLRCDYCRISRDYERPPEYKDKTLKYFHNNEMKTEDILEALRRLKLHNSDCFSIFYGGEPALRSDLSEIIGYCHKESINYTIISNMTDNSKRVIDKLIEDHGYLQGLTASIDPIIMEEYNNVIGDVYKKTFNGFSLLKYKGKVHDLVAEITCSNDNLKNLYPLVKKLTDSGINSDITFVDISKSLYYDFSNVTDDDLLVYKSAELREIINRIIDEKLDVHMRDILLPAIYNILPSNLDCKIEDDVHNITIDADGSVRLCLRIMGCATPENFNLLNFLDENGKMHENLKDMLTADKARYCKLCNWSCPLMSNLLSKNEGDIESLLHSERRT